MAVRTGFVAIVALAALIVAAPAEASERARPMGLYTVASGAALPMIESRVALTVRGPIVEAVVTQRFANPSDRATEATYIFPLPLDAAVTAMTMKLGARTIRAAIEPRAAAQQRYEAAVRAGLAAAVLDQERDDVFTQTVSAIPPRGTVEVTLRYDSVARYEAGAWQLVVPMVVAPRFVPGTASGVATTGTGRAPDTDRAPDASRVTPAASPGAGGSTKIALRFVDAPRELASPTHELIVENVKEATLSDPRSDHDAIVRWRAAVPAAGWVERDASGGFAAVVIEAAAPPAKRGLVRAILALDRAATTRGDADAIARPVVRALLGALDARDRVRAIGSAAIAWSSADDLRAALERAWVAPATPFDLTRVLETARPEGAAILLISDGLVADDAAAIAAARKLGVAIHAIGVGPAPARALLTQLAAVTGGTVRFAVAGDDLDALARAVLADLASPPAPLAITWGTLAARDVAPSILPRLGAGQAMVAFARTARVEAANGRAAGALFAFEALDATTTPTLSTHGALGRRWARERLGSMLLAPHDRAAVARFAIEHGLVSPYTSLVAIGTEIVVEGGVQRSIAVPVSLPAGMQWHAVQQQLQRETNAIADERTPKPAEAAKQDRSEAPRAQGATTTDTAAEATDAARSDDEELERVAVAETISTSNRGRAWQLAASLTGGLAIDHGAHAGLSLAARLDMLRGRSAIGAELGLQLVGDDAAGTALLTYLRDLHPRFAVGVGIGATFGRGAGIASGLRLHVATPWPWLVGVARYDASLLLGRDNDLVHSLTLGIELTY